MACLQGQPNRKQLVKDVLKGHPPIVVDAHAGEALSALAEASDLDSPESSEQD